ncbi:MAG: hypothetical protein E6J71_06705 [Deltaproteobacteria bacterium]|nr:MAG: hypothetical protein E6J71_06705 [Deltaproteobacteria bacterium]
MAALLGLALLAGCATMFTNIEKENDGSYTVTQIAQGFWTIHGRVYRCTDSGGSLTCTKIDSKPW